jgi:hypothetical protein
LKLTIILDFPDITDVDGEEADAAIDQVEAALAALIDAAKADAGEIDEVYLADDPVIENPTPAPTQ